MSKVLADLCDPTRSICYGIVQPGNDEPDGLPIIRVKDLTGNRIDTASAMRVAPEIEAKYKRSRVRAGDVLISLVGSMGQVAIASPEVDGWNIARAVGLIPAVDRHHAEWIKFALQSPEAQSFIRDHANTTVQATFNLKDLARIPIPYPPVEERKEITSTLGALDDKIELNRKTAATLEEMARALYRSWFVDFDPVRARAEGRTPAHMDPATAALFPDNFGEDGLPVGWSQQPIAFFGKCQLGGTPSRSKPAYWGGDVPWINSGAVNKFRITAPSEMITQEGLSRSATKLLPRRTTVIAITGATLGQVSLTEIEVCANQSVVGVVCQEPFQEVVYFGIKATIDELINHQTGGAQQHINKGNVEKHPLVYSGIDVCEAFAVAAKPILDKIAQLEFESCTLIALRDTLLPRLMSGELRVGAAREMLEEVA